MITTALLGDSKSAESFERVDFKIDLHTLRPLGGLRDGARAFQHR